jgi:rhodanese-related sulfurtransferase
MHLPGFLMAAGAGACLWAGLALGAGWLLKDEVQAAIGALDRHTGTALAVVLPLIGAWLGWKLWQKYRFRRSSTVPHITPDELIEALRSQQPPLILDLRGATMIAETDAVPGAKVAEHDRLDDAVGDWPRSRPIVTLCACPEDAGAIAAARHLLDDGYLSVRVLQGGYDAWLAATRNDPPRQ